MKLLSLALPSLLLVAMVSSVGAQEGRVTVRVTNSDTGAVVTNAEVRASFNTSIQPGWGWGGGRPNRETGVTDKNGICALSGSGNGGSVGIAVGCEGYYWSSGYSVRFTNVVGGLRKKWQPWNPVVDVALRRIGEPGPMYAKRIRHLEVPRENVPIGFDLAVGDWVAPDGDGRRSDMIFRLDREPERVVERVSPHRTYKVTLHDLTLTVRGSVEGDGFSVVSLTPVGRGPTSGLRMPREAPALGYEPSIVKRVYNSADESPHTDVREDANYILRVRTEKVDGSVISALYGKIHGDFHIDYHGKLSFTYYLNPTPNDRNLEFDPQRNLFADLSSLEEVREP